MVHKQKNNHVIYRIVPLLINFSNLEDNVCYYNLFFKKNQYLISEN